MNASALYKAINGCLYISDVKKKISASNCAMPNEVSGNISVTPVNCSDRIPLIILLA